VKPFTPHSVLHSSNTFKKRRNCSYLISHTSSFVVAVVVVVVFVCVVVSSSRPILHGRPYWLIVSFFCSFDRRHLSTVQFKATDERINGHSSRFYTHSFFFFTTNPCQQRTDGGTGGTYDLHLHLFLLVVNSHSAIFHTPRIGTCN
jgi:hypothetical protein